MPRTEKKLRVGIIFGGRSCEHEVSLASAISVMAHLDPEKYEVVPIGMTRAGQWINSASPMAMLRQDQKQSALLEEKLPPGDVVNYQALHSNACIPGYVKWVACPTPSCWTI